MADIPPGTNASPIPPWYYKPGVQPPGLSSRSTPGGPEAGTAVGGSGGVRKRIPGFRSGTWWKAVIACLFYGFGLLGVIVGLVTAQWALAGFYLSILAIGVLAVLLVSYWRFRPANVVIAGALVIALGGFGISAASAPRQSATPQPLSATQPPNQPPRPSGAGIAATNPTATAAPTETPTPTATATPTAAPTPPPTPAATPPPATPPPATPPPPPPPTQNLCGAPSNPWGYNFCGGATISNPPSNFCTYFSCIPSFWNGNGYVIECQDTMYSKSGGIRGSCSYHGGDLRALYQ
jgi:hypothetical protein